MKTCKNCDKRRIRKDGLYVCIIYHFCEFMLPHRGGYCDKYVALTPETKVGNVCDSLELFSSRQRRCATVR